MSEAEGPYVFFDRDIRARPSINCGSFHHLSTERVGGSANLTHRPNLAGARLEETDTRIQTGSCHANENDERETACNGDRIESIVSLGRGNRLI
jgi:hypothetical protein